MFVKIGEGAGSLLRGGIASGESSGIPATRFGDDSMECDNCQGNGTKFIAFELRRNKGSGWKGLAGIWEFSETETKSWLWLLVGVALWFARATAEGAVSPGGGALRTALGATAELAESGGHPLFGAEETFQERGKIEVGVEFWEVKAEARWTNFYVAERRGGGVFETLSDVRRKADIQMGTEVNDDAAALAVVVRGYGPRSGLAHLAGTLIG